MAGVIGELFSHKRRIIDIEDELIRLKTQAFGEQSATLKAQKKPRRWLGGVAPHSILARQHDDVVEALLH